MYRSLFRAAIIFCVLIFLILLSAPNEMKANGGKSLILRSISSKENLYPSLYMLNDSKKPLTIEDVVSEKYSEQFVLAENVVQSPGFSQTSTWLRIDVENQSNQRDWLLEVAYHLIYKIVLYSEDESGLHEVYHTGSDFPFNQREIMHRNFVFNLEIDHNQSKRFYLLVHSGGDLHPPITIWSGQSFIEKTQVEFILLGLFYGMTSVMVLYNLFLYFSLRIKSYLYYVFVITFTIMANLQKNGLGFQYLWPNSPVWNTMANPIFVSLTCIFILLFAKNFLDTNQYFPKFKILFNILIPLNVLIVPILLISNHIALNIMVISTTCTFITVLTTAFICLKAGARQARFFIIGWFFYLIGILITILATATVLPFNAFTEFAGQNATGIEVVLLSLALADKINIMRLEKETAERETKMSQALVLKSLEKADEHKDEFLAITSHELRTPLYGMIGIAESLRDGVAGDLSNEMSNQLSMIIASGNRLTYLVNDILDYSNLKHKSLHIHLKSVYLVRIVDVVFTICSPLANNKFVKLINKVDDTLPPVLADINRLQQILYNIVGNAIKYSDHGEVVISAEKLNDRIKIIISDTGVGIPADQLEEIFEPFQQIDPSISRSVSGSGIGLSITKHLVELHGGQIEVASKVGIGSTFSFTLPFQKDELHVQEEAIASEAYFDEEPAPFTPSLQVMQKEITILVVDDEPINLQVLVNQLSLEGYRVITATDGEQVLRIVEDQTIDLLILDIMMPKMSGYEVCQQLRETYTLMELPILMLTAKSQIRDKITSFEIGANDYLSKPCDKQELLARVKTLAQLRSMNEELLNVNLKLENKVKNRTEALEVANNDLKSKNDDLIIMAKSRRELLANIAHELGTPVTLIHSYMQALHGGLVLSDDSHFRNFVYDKINVLNRLIDDLFDLSKLEAGQTSLNLEKLNLDRWLEQIYDKFEVDVLQSKRFSERPKDTKMFKRYSCLIDIERMDQVFSNLVRNAVNHTSKKNGKISIHAELLEFENRVVIEVRDNGSGISKKSIPLIFGRFYKELVPLNEEKERGTGLGLAIVNEIVISHKGSISVESVVNEGSVFFISLPIQSKGRWK
ncbi:ATP-binding protein [Sporosarcina siberiensis]|uniref:histidine kinase n=1 Tax=Sporosarcina siberiensis TaxID=1365606 RepID=A0ABW4SBF0_9BACL